jgi:hypothetical protein
MNERNVEALAAIIEQIKDAASDEYVWHDGLARLLAAAGVLAPQAITQDDCAKITENWEWGEWANPSDPHADSVAEMRKTLERIAQGED